MAIWQEWNPLTHKIFIYLESLIWSNLKKKKNHLSEFS